MKLLGNIIWLIFGGWLNWLMPFGARVVEEE